MLVGVQADERKCRVSGYAFGRCGVFCPCKQGILACKSGVPAVPGPESTATQLSGFAALHCLSLFRLLLTEYQRLGGL